MGPGERLASTGELGVVVIDKSQGQPAATSYASVHRNLGVASLRALLSSLL